MIHTVKRSFWLQRIEELWKIKSIIWLQGVRRVGKTYLCLSIPDAEYYDCELPRTRQLLEDPEEFFRAHREKKIILDEIHRLDNPSELLKIGADYYATTKLIATGSSTLGASARFRDTLTDRKRDLWLLPLVWEDLVAFGNQDITFRLERGGLPSFFLSEEISATTFQDWIDSFWAKDIQELFRIGRKHSFQKFIELLFAQSGGIFEANHFAKPCEVSRPTISNYLSILNATFVMHSIRPFSLYPKTEITKAPKVYAFDTGFITYWKGWESLRSEDLGLLWEHLILNELQSFIPARFIHYWRDKQGHEIDFVIAQRQKFPLAIECKWKVKQFDPRALKIFRQRYPEGSNVVIASDIDRPFRERDDGVVIQFIGIHDLVHNLKV